MSETKDFGSFFKENKKLAKKYLDTKLEIYRLQAIRVFSKSSGFVIWIIISLMLLFLLVVFLGVVSGFWMSEITGSYIKGFGLTTLFILILILVVAVFRRSLFINPIIKAIIKQTNTEALDTEKDYHENDAT